MVKPDNFHNTFFLIQISTMKILYIELYCILTTQTCAGSTWFNMCYTQKLQCTRRLL